MHGAAPAAPIGAAPQQVRGARPQQVCVAQPDDGRGRTQAGGLPRNASMCGALTRAADRRGERGAVRLRAGRGGEHTSGEAGPQDAPDQLAGAGYGRGGGAARADATQRQGRGLPRGAGRAAARPLHHRGLRLLPAAALPRHAQVWHAEHPPVAAAALPRSRAAAALPGGGRRAGRRDRRLHRAQDGRGPCPPPADPQHGRRRALPGATHRGLLHVRVRVRVSSPRCVG